MIDTFHLPDANVQNIVQFRANGGGWQTWIKPRGINFISMFLIGGGGGGGGGFTGATASQRSGGGGGASSATSRALFLASTLPDTLYIQVGAGGAGGTATLTGSSGGISYVGVMPNIGSPLALCLLSSSTAASGGGAGTGSTSGTGGTGSGTASLANSLIAYNALSVNFTPAPSGLNGGTTGNASNVTLISGGMYVAATGGGGVSTGNAGGLGGSQNGQGFYNTVAGSPADTAGSNGAYIRQPLFLVGGTGGGGSGAATGGKGGDGGIGSGGGGGGGGITGGAGGKGGDGMVIIACW